jgi:hypothetical protein
MQLLKLKTIKIMAKFDIKDGFCQLECKAGAEWNFTYIMPQEKCKPLNL